MAILSFNDLAQSYGPDDIFVGASGSIPHQARVGLVGPNGIGKTTLLRVLAGHEPPAHGKLHLARNTRLGYLPQGSSGVSKRKLWDEMLDAVAELRAAEARLAELAEAMADPNRYDATIEEYATLEASFERQGGYTYEVRIRQTLQGLGFDKTDYQTPILQLSGGQKTRALLARLLIEAPDLLILDEPTNHLDVAAIEWLESYLRGWAGAMLIVSHDRYFLDKVVSVIWEMSAAGIETYRGNYAAYVQQRQERWDLRHQTYETEKARLLKELDYIKRNIAGQRTSQAKGKLRRLSREIEALEKGGIQALQGKNWARVAAELDLGGRMLGVAELESRIKALKPAARRPPAFNLRLNARGRSGDIVLRTEGLHIGYPDAPLFEAGDIELRRLGCVALIGPNGSGKTTFLRTILGQHKPLAGSVSLGASLRVGYFSQAHEDLQPRRNLVQEIQSVARHMGMAETRNYLGRFLFSGEDVFKPVETLSGGERGRLALAKLTLSDANFLLLDEPTNHLDIPAQELLQAVLSEFGGTILMVSHDRYLIDYLATQIWAIEGQRLAVFHGNYREFLARQVADSQATKSVASAASAYKRRNAARRTIEKATRQRTERLTELEAQIHALEARLGPLTAALEAAGEAQNIDRVHELGSEYEQTEGALAQLIEAWTELAQ